MDTMMLDAISSAAGASLAVSNGRRHGEPILPIDLTAGHLWNSVPTDSPESAIDPTGDELRAMLEANQHGGHSVNPARLSGLRRKTPTSLATGLCGRVPRQTLP